MEGGVGLPSFAKSRVGWAKLGVGWFNARSKYSVCLAVPVLLAASPLSVAYRGGRWGTLFFGLGYLPSEATLREGGTGILPQCHSQYAACHHQARFV